MHEKFGRHLNSVVSLLGDRVADVDGVPVDVDRGEQVEAGDPVMLPLSGAITDLE